MHRKNLETREKYVRELSQGYWKINNHFGKNKTPLMPPLLVKPVMHNAEKWPSVLLKSCGVHVTKNHLKLV